MTINYYITKITNKTTVDYYPSRYNVFNLYNQAKATSTHESKCLLYWTNNPIKFNIYSIETNTLKELYESNT